MSFNPNARIVFELEGLDEKSVTRLRETIETLIAQKVFFIKNGKAILNFDDKSRLGAIEIHYRAWKRIDKINTRTIIK